MFKSSTFLLLLIFLSLNVSAFAQKGTRVGYIDMDVILEKIDEYNKASQLLDKSIERWKKESMVLLNPKNSRQW